MWQDTCHCHVALFAWDIAVAEQKVFYKMTLFKSLNIIIHVIIVTKKYLCHYQVTKTQVAGSLGERQY